MAGTLQPIAAFTAEDYGPINTIVSIVFSVTSILFTIVRMAMRRQKFYRLESDDIVFCLGLFVGLLTFILSHFCVRAGLGRHQETLDEKQVVDYFKIFWKTQISVVVTLALAKLSLFILLRRIVPNQTRPQTIYCHVLALMIAVYAVASLLLIAFQCQQPEPWILSPGSCNTHGKMYYCITSLNILTDAILAFWIFPVIWRLQMKERHKSVILWLFGSRLLVCVVDIGRMLVIHRALQVEDQTRSQLGWALMDQAAVFCSINHATLPRIKNFLSNLKTGGLSTHMSASRSGTSSTSKGGSSATKTDQSHLNENKVYQIFNNVSHKLRSCFRGSLNRSPSISELPLTQQGIELSTIKAGQRNVEQDQSAAALLSSEVLTGLGGVRVKTEIHVDYDQMRGVT